MMLAALMLLQPSLAPAAVPVASVSYRQATGKTTGIVRQLPAKPGLE